MDFGLCHIINNHDGPGVGSASFHGKIDRSDELNAGVDHLRSRKYVIHASTNCLAWPSGHVQGTLEDFTIKSLFSTPIRLLGDLFPRQDVLACSVNFLYKLQQNTKALLAIPSSSLSRDMHISSQSNVLDQTPLTPPNIGP